MARARNIKPAFFNNDQLAENEPLGRLLFIGLWTICDIKGQLECRPRRIKAQLLPYDNCDIEALLINLDKSGFIRFYSSHGSKYIKIIKFEKHQNPHKNERDRGTIIPDYSKDLEETLDFIELQKDSSNIAINPDKDGSDRADSLIPYPDSPILIPETLIPEDRKKPDANKFADSVSEIFEFWKLTMGKTDQNKLTKKRKSLIEARLKEGYTLEDIKTAITGCAKSPFHMGQNDQGTIHDDLTLICRSGDKLEGFSQNVAKLTPTTPSGGRQNGPETLEQFKDSVDAQVDRIFGPMEGFDA